MTVGLVLLVVVAILVFFGVAQRVLDKLRLTDRAALLFVALMFFGGIAPAIPLGAFSINVGGALVPLALCVYLLVKAGTAKERWRAILASVLTGAAVYALGSFLPNEPEQTLLDPNYLYGLAGGVIAYLLGRSRRGAFIAGVLGVLLADIAVAIVNAAYGVHQQLVLGGAGMLDATVISGILAVLLAELVGEIAERVARGKASPHDRPIENPVAPLRKAESEGRERE